MDDTAKFLSGFGRRVLVVDDFRGNADSMKLVLDAMGYEVRVAYGGQEALESASEVKPDVILLDIDMPDLNGYEVAAFIRKQRWGEGMLLIAITGLGQEIDKHRSREAGIDHHLVKPLALDDLMAILDNLPPR